MYAFIIAAQTFVADRFDKKNDRGATAVEYGLIVGLIAVAVIAVLVTLGPAIADMFQQVEDELPATA